jgi:hypothetical protein
MFLSVTPSDEEDRDVGIKMGTEYNDKKEEE